MKSFPPFLLLLIALAISAPAVAGIGFMPLSLKIEPVKHVFQVDEPVRFRVRDRRSFYLYLFSIDQTTGEAVMILPNRLQRDNRYAGGRSHVLPDRQVEFYVASPGSERVIAIATLAPIELDPAVYPSREAFPVLTREDLAAAFSPYEIDPLSDSWPDGSSFLSIVDVRFQVVDQPRRRVRADSPEGDAEAGFPVPTLALAADRSRYLEGEQMRIVVGADRAGQVRLYNQEPSGALELISVRELQPLRMERVEATALGPVGRQRLIALFTTELSGADDFVSRITRLLGRNEAPAEYADGATAVVDYLIEAD